MALNKIGQNKWRITVSVRDKNKGYPITKQKTVEGTRSEAVIVEGELLKELKARSLTSAYASTFSEALTLHVEHLRVRGTLAPRHEAWYNRLRQVLGRYRIDEFAEHYEQYIKEYEQRPTVRGNYPTGATLNRLTATVRAVFNRLVELGIIDKNPITTARFPKYDERPRDRYLSQEERLRLLAVIRDERPYILPIVQYMLSVPCRVSELTTALVSQYRPLTKTIYIPDSKARIPLHKPIPPDMLNYFESIPSDCPYLFYEYKRGRYRSLVHKLPRAWSHVVDTAGLSDLRIHDLRHIAATDMVLAGNSERVVMKVAGWKSNMLSTYYHNDSLFSAQQAVFGSADYSHVVACSG